MACAGSVRALLDMGVFETLPIDGQGMTIQALAEKVNVEEDLLSKSLLVSYLQCLHAACDSA
jgi:hypothetical protein